MKKSLIFIFFLSILFYPSKADGPWDSAVALNQVLASIRTGSSKELAKYFEPSIMLNLNGQNGNYSRVQAEYILRDFFHRHPPMDFKILHKGGHSGTSLYYVGTYLSHESQFRVLIKGNPKEESFRIFSMEILHMNTYTSYRPRN